MKLWIIFCSIWAAACGCGFPGSPAHCGVTFSNDSVGPGTIATYTCDRGFELLGPGRKICNENGTWTPPGIPFCVLNVAAGKAPMQSSVAGEGIPQKAVDGSTSSVYTPESCAMTKRERNPWWYVNLLEPYMVQLVRIDFGQNCCGERHAVIEIRVGNNRPDIGTNPICNRFEGRLEEGRPLFLPCSPPMPGAFVSVHFVEPVGESLSICETFVYTDQALPIERCPSHRDQHPGSTSTYNGKCYIFHSDSPKNFDEAFDECKGRGGSLVDETNPALQGFLSWELWRRHRGEKDGQYWLGTVRDPNDPNNWKWINGRDVTISFWNLPGGNENCARFDGTKGWLWSDTNCLRKINFICQHRPKACGKPEQPPNSTMAADNFDVGAEVSYLCDPGHVLVGPATRKCLNSGFFNEFPPNCQFIDCGTAAPIRHGIYELVNATSHYKSVVRYGCNPGYVLAGRSELVCEVDGRWNGPPPRCLPEHPEKPGLKEIDHPMPEEFPNDSSHGPSYDTNEIGDSQAEDSIRTHVTVLPAYEGETSGNDLSFRTNKGPSVNNPSYTEKDRTTRANIPLGGIIALGVFGGFVFLAAIITTIVILVRRTQGSGKNYIRRHDDVTTSSDASSTDGHGLNRFYKKAWDTLGDGGVPPLQKDSEKGVQRPRGDEGRGDFRSTRSTGQEGLRDGSEMTVNDVAAMYTRPEKKRHHHHHHNHRHKGHEGEQDQDRHEKDRHEKDRHDRDWRDRDRRKY